MRPRPISALVVANIKRQTRDRVGLFFMVVMPFVTIMFVGLAMGGADDKIPVAVVAQDSDPTARAVLEQLEKSPSLEVRRADSADEVRTDVRRGTVAAGLVMTPGSTEFDLVLTQTSGSGMAARSEIDVAIGKVSAVQEATRAAEKAGATPQLAEQYVAEAQAEGGAVAVRNSGGDDGTPSGFAYTAPANLLLFTFINSMAVAAALVESRRIGMVRRTLAGPVSKGVVLLGEGLSRLLVAAAQAVMIIIVSSLMFGVSWGDPLGVGIIVGLFCLVATGAAMLVGALVNNPQQAPAIGPPLGIVLGMLGGCLWPKEVAGEVLATVGYAFPHAWAMDGLLALTRPGTGIGAVWQEAAVLAGMAALSLGVAVVVFRRRALQAA
ncbi:ABC transporter permease [Actinokineospora guangxiensis]|uniref:ABC transporter permease n=1 Tax=Actinokineospora guangxiensis TaxID=1490288 RepID=A0ABW0EHF3_9PSEU